MVVRNSPFKRIVQNRWSFSLILFLVLVGSGCRVSGLRFSFCVTLGASTAIAASTLSTRSTAHDGNSLVHQTRKDNDADGSPQNKRYFWLS